MRHNMLSRGGSVLLLFTLLLLAIAPVRAQTATPTFANVTVALWPEFDRPEVLVVYRVQLDSTAPLPAQVAFHLPGYIEETHAVAVGGETGLMTVPAENIQIQPAGETQLLSFPATSARVQIEYYDPFILTRDGVERQLGYSFVAPYDLEAVNFEIQQPFQARDFTVTPAPVDTFTGSDGLRYSRVQVQNVTAGETVRLAASYQRPTDQLSVQALQAAPAAAAEGALDIPTTAALTEEAAPPYLAYGLLGAGAVLLLGTGGYWLLQRNKDAAAGQQPRRRQPVRRKTRAAESSRQPARTGASGAQAANRPAGAARYCYSCGTALRDDANFCHICGAERRGD